VKLAKIKDFDSIWSEFKKNRNVFPHIRTDYLKRQIKKDNVIYDKGVILISNSYKRNVTLGNKKFKSGDHIIHQILNSKQGNGNATKVLKRYLGKIDNCRCILTVRRDNATARDFYEKNNFKCVGKINWSHNKIRGLIYST